MKRALAVVPALLWATRAPIVHADIPPGYQGKPFDPAVAGGPTLPPGVTAGPYAIPGRLEFENYDMGGLNVGYFTTDHITCGASGYRKDGVTASLCVTSPKPDTVYAAPRGDVYYDTGDPTLDGTTYPNATATDVYIGAVRPGDWVNITVDVKTAGTYRVGSTWASGNGPPGKEGGNGAMELQVFVNGTKALDWTAVFPNYATEANFHNWKPYPDMGTVTLEPGLQVIKLDTGADPHLNLDYVQFSLVLPDGGADAGDGSSGNADGGGSATADAEPATGPDGDAGESSSEPSAGSSPAGSAGCGCRVVATGSSETRVEGLLGMVAAALLLASRVVGRWHEGPPSRTLHARWLPRTTTASQSLKTAAGRSSSCASRRPSPLRGCKRSWMLWSAPTTAASASSPSSTPPRSRSSPPPSRGKS